jgi:hypothetical protein
MDNKERKKSRNECASSNAGGAMGGMLLSAIGSSINPILALPGNVIGASMGSVAFLMLSQLNIPSIKKLLSKKLSSDFSTSFITDERILYNEIENFKDRMRRNLDVYSNSHTYFMSNEVWEFHCDSDLSKDVEVLL